MPAEVQQVFGQFAHALLAVDAPRPAFLRADEKRFNVYRNNVTLGLMRALQANFPAIRSLVGEEFFNAMALDYVRSHPPESRLLFEFGRHLPEFLQQAESLQNYSYLPDVARYEWSWLQCFHEADGPVLTGEMLSAVIGRAGVDVHFAMHPAARLLRAPNAFCSIAEASRQSRTLAGIVAGRAEYCVLTRPGITVQSRLVSHEHYDFLQAIAQGRSLAEAADAALAVNPHCDVQAAITLVLETGFCTAPSMQQDEP